MVVVVVVVVVVEVDIVVVVVEEVVVAVEVVAIFGHLRSHQQGECYYCCYWLVSFSSSLLLLPNYFLCFFIWFGLVSLD